MDDPAIRSGFKVFGRLFIFTMQRNRVLAVSIEAW
jgi:hypothetical protein